MKITRLTPAQTEAMPRYAEKWLQHGLNTTPANRPAAEEGVRAAYRSVGLEPPKIFVWLNSPLAGAYGAMLLANLPNAQVGAQVGDQVGDQVSAQVVAQAVAQVVDQVWDQVWLQVEDQVRDQVEDQVGAQVVAQVVAQVRDQVRDQIRIQVVAQVRAQVVAQAVAQVVDQVGAQVRDQVGAQVRDQVRDQINRAVWGQHEYWLSFYDYMRGELDLECVDKLAGVVQVAQNSGWWWPFTGIVILTERPTKIVFDNQRLLHCDDGPAIVYPDGFAVYAWHGTRVDADLIEGDGWAYDRILREGNTEIRRCAIERMGWPAFIAAAGLSRIGRAVPDPGNPGHELELYQLPSDIFNEPVNVLICNNATDERDGSRRRFGLTVPGSITDPLAASGWTFGLDPSDYRKMQRAT